MISSQASKCQDFKRNGLQFQFIKQLKNRNPNFEDLPFLSQLNSDHNQSSLCHKNQILKKTGGSGNPASLIPALWKFIYLVQLIPTTSFTKHEIEFHQFKELPRVFYI